MTTLTLAAALLAAAAPASAAPVATTYTQGLSAAPTDIALGPDGNLWFTESGDPGRVGRITPAGLVTEFTAGLTPNAQPTGIAAGPDGAMWFTERAKARIGRIATDGSITELPVWGGAQPFGIASGPDGALYFTDRTGRLGRLTTSGVVDQFGPVSGSSPEEIALGPDGNLWFTEKAAVGRLTPGGDIAEFALGLSSDAPTDIAAGPDGNLWFTNQRSPGSLGRISPLGVSAQFSAGLTPNSKPAGIAAGADGALWFAEPSGLGRIDTQGQITEYGLAGGAQPSRLAVGSDGALWFTDRACAIGRFGPAPAGQVPDGSGGETTEVPVPRLGRQVVVHPVRGTVRVRRPNGHGFEELEEGAAIPVGSLVDTRHGAVRLSSALDSDGHTQSGIFSGGVFSVSQTADGMTDIYLRGGSFAGCRSLKAVASADRRKRRAVRSLWGRDRRGRFRTHGRDSVATVRGTTWLTQDRCDGTLTVVKAGAVEVRERRTHRTVVVRAGGRHLARRGR